MSISASTLSPQFFKAEAFISPKLTASELNQEFARAFENFDVKRAAELFKMGANPNQEITLSRPLVAEFLKLSGICDCSGPVNREDESTETFLESDENLQLAVDEFFNGEYSHPALLLSMVLRKDDFSCLLLENGGELLCLLDKDNGFNILQLSAVLSLPKVAKSLLQTKSCRADQTKNGEIPPPFVCAVFYGDLDTVKVFLETCPEQLDSMIVALLKSEDIQDEIEAGSTRLIEIKQLLEEHLKQKEYALALKA